MLVCVCLFVCVCLCVSGCVPVSVCLCVDVSLKIRPFYVRWIMNGMDFFFILRLIANEKERVQIVIKYINLLEPDEDMYDM